MADLTPPQCRSCGSRLRFVRMLTGKAMPCNPVADPSGNVAARKLARGGYGDGVVLAKGETAPAGFTTFRPHWADCDMRLRNRAPVAPNQPLF